MATQKGKVSIQDALRGNLTKKGDAELRSDLEGLFSTLTGYDLVDAVIERVQRYAVEASGKTMDRDFGRMAPYQVDQIKERIREELIGHLSSFITDAHRGFIVRSHAQGLSTADAVVELMITDKTDKSVGARGRYRFAETSRNVDSSIGVFETGVGAVA